MSKKCSYVTFKTLYCLKMLTVIWDFSESCSFCWWRVLSMAADHSGVGWSLGRLCQFRKACQQWHLLHWQPKITRDLSPSQESQPLLWSFEARNWLLVSSYGSPRRHLLPTGGCFNCTDNLRFSASTFVNYLS